MGGRIDVEANDIPELVGELRVVRQLEGSDAVRGKLVGFENALDGAQADAGGLGQHPPGPVGCLARWRAERQIEDACTVSGGRGALPGGLVLSRSSPSTPSCMKRSCQRQTTGLALPDRRITSKVPQPSAVARMILARQTCFWGELRSATIASSRRRSSGVTLTMIPALIPRA